jgi:hypothetical protein
MQEKLLLLTSRRVAGRLTDIFDFVWPTAAAIWNLRWQVEGLVRAVPMITEEDLLGRFVAGSGIRGANLRRACIELSWADQQREFARFLLFEFCTLYEAWCEGALQEMGITEDLSKHLQFPDAIDKHGKKSGVSHALTRILVPASTVLATALFPVLSKNRKYSLTKLDNLLRCYRYFKELRNLLIHGGGNGAKKLIAAETEYSQLSAADLGVSERPEFVPNASGSPAAISLRGVVGFGEVVLRLVCTLDVEFSKAGKAEAVFIRRWNDTHGKKLIHTAADAMARRERIYRLVRKIGLPTPIWSAQFEAWLKSHQLIV